MITDQQREQLWHRAEEVLGREEAAILMDAIDHPPWADLATKQDLRELAAATKQDLRELAAATKQELRELESRFEERLDRRLAETTRDLQRTFVTWLFASQTSLAAIVAILVAILVAAS